MCHIKETRLEIFSREWDFNVRDEGPSFRNIYDEIFSMNYGAIEIALCIELTPLRSV